MPISKHLLKDLRERRKAIIAGGGEDKLEARRKKGLMTARDRLDNLYQPGTFLEFGMHAHHSNRNFGMEKKVLPADAVVTGTGLVEGRPVAAFSQDFTVAGGSLGAIHAQKIVDVMDYALRSGMPVVSFNDSGGARIQEGVESLSGYGKVFFKNVYLSGVVPQIAVIAGPCAGGVFPGSDGFSHHGQGQCQYVHLRSGCDSGSHRSEMHHGGSGRSGSPCKHQWEYSLCGGQ
jgi:propionyl-CoA carboxylase beta chain